MRNFVGVLDKLLGSFGLSWSGDYSEYYRNKADNIAVENAAMNPEVNPLTKSRSGDRLKILSNTLCTIEDMDNATRRNKEKYIEELMISCTALPYQIVSCHYIGDGKAWAMYNLNNKRTLSLAINEINFHLSTFSKLENDKETEAMMLKILPLKFHINFDNICFDYGEKPVAGQLPRSYILYSPKTKAGKWSQYPLIAYFNTIHDGSEDNNGENYAGELYYAISGDLARANVRCWNKAQYARFDFSVIGRSFGITTIKVLGKSGKLFNLYDRVQALTDYFDIGLEVEE